MNERLSLCMTPTRSRSRGIFWGANVPGSHREAYVCSFYRSRSLCGGGTEPCRRRKTYLDSAVFVGLRNLPQSSNSADL